MAALIGAVLVGGLLSLLPGLLAVPTAASRPWAAIALFTVLTVLAQRLAATIGERNKTSVAIVPILAAGFVAGDLGIAAAGLAFALYNKIEKRSPIHRMLFNLGMILLATEAGRWTFSLLVPGPLVQVPFERMILPAALAGLADYAVNHLLMSLVRGLAERRQPWQVWHADYRWLWPHYVVLGILALVVAAGHEAFGWTGAVALMAPVAMMHLAIRQYVDRTTASVRQLGMLNEQLQAEIAQRRAAEEENAHLAREAARTAALEELSRLKSEFVSIASHELRTPIAGIVGFSELLLHDPEVPLAQRQQWLAIINRQSEHLATLVDNLLDVSRFETGALRLDACPVDLPTLLPPVVELLSASLSGHTIAVDIAPDARSVQADAEKLRQILTNLVGNAIKYSPAGGQITITARRAAASDRVALAVADQGIGIPAEHLERIFERFQRVDASTTRDIRGTGLGLYIVRQLVELHGGTIRVESEIGRGSTFHVTLPAAPSPSVDVTSDQAGVGLAS